jgi:hypothetical protein
LVAEALLMAVCGGKANERSHRSDWGSQTPASDFDRWWPTAASPDRQSVYNAAIERFL